MLNIYQDNFKPNSQLTWDVHNPAGVKTTNGSTQLPGIAKAVVLHQNAYKALGSKRELQDMYSTFKNVNTLNLRSLFGIASKFN